MRTRRKLGLAAATLVILVAAAAGAAQLWAQRTAKQRVDATIANLPQGETGHYDQLHYNLFNQRLHLVGLVITREGQTVFSAGRVTLLEASGAGTTDDPFRVGSANIADITTTQNGHHLTIDTLTAEDVSALGAGVSPPLGLATWPSLPEGGTLLAARRITASGIHDDTGSSIVKLAVADYRAGHLRAGSLTAFADARGDRVASIAVDQLDLDGLDRVFDAQRYAAGAPSWPERRPLIGHLAIKGVSIADMEKGSASIADIGLDGLSGRPFAAAPGSAEAKTMKAAMDDAQAIALKGLTLHGISLTAPKQEMAFNLQRFALSGYGDAVLDRIGFEGLSVKGTLNRTVTIDRFALRGINAAALLKESPDISNFDLMMRAGSGAVRVAGLELAGLATTTAPGVTSSLTSLEETVDNGTPLRVQMTMRGLSLPAGIAPGPDNPLVALGIDPLVLDADEVWVTDLAKREATIEQGRVAARGLATLEVTGHFTNLPIGTTSVEEAFAQIEQIATTKMMIRFTNETLIQRVLTMVAKQQSKTVPEVKDEANLAASVLAGTFLSEQKDAAEQIAAFIDQPKTLTITADPAGPVVLSKLDGPDSLIAQRALHLHIAGD
jgi:hypothetical protein